MTTLAILSDIHGNLPALEAVLHDMAQCRVDHIVVAGDLINWGPFSAQVMERVTQAGCALIRGNNEFYLLDYDTPRAPAEWGDRSHFPLLPWLQSQLGGRWQSVIAALPDQLSLRFPDAPPIRVVHGSARSAWESLFPDSPEGEIAAMLEGVAETFVIAGHTHLPMDRAVGRWRIFNPGTVGVPIDGTRGARYMLLHGGGDTWHPVFRLVPYDLTPLFAEFRRQRFVEEGGVIAQLVVKEFESARLQVHPFVYWRLANHPHAPIHQALLDEFAKADVSDYIPPAYRHAHASEAGTFVTKELPVQAVPCHDA